jgi:hypothetical protein
MEAQEKSSNAVAGSPAYIEGILRASRSGARTARAGSSGGGAGSGADKRHSSSGGATSAAHQHKQLQRVAVGSHLEHQHLVVGLPEEGRLRVARKDFNKKFRRVPRLPAAPLPEFGVLPAPGACGTPCLLGAADWVFCAGLGMRASAALIPTPCTLRERSHSGRISRGHTQVAIQYSAPMSALVA